VGNDTAAAYLANGDPSHPVGQGIPYNQKPTGLRLYYKCDVMSGDTAIIFLMFKAGGNIISQNIQKITGTQIGYTLLTFSVNLAVTPDSLIFGALSSNILGNSKGIPGSMLQIDSVSFTGVASQPLLMNGDFENWQTITNNTLQNWSIQGSHSNNNNNTVQTTDAYLGTYALELQTLGTNQAGDTAYSTSASTGYSTNFGTAGGYPYTQTNDSLIFYYKYVPADINDSAEVILDFKKAGFNFQTQSQLFKASANYIRAAMPISLMQTPDSVIVSINSSKNWSVPPAYLGADLKIDNIYFKSQPIIAAAALNFDGVDDHIFIPQSVSQDFTIEYWVKTTQTAGTGAWYNGNGIVDAEMPGATQDFGTSLVGNNFAFGVGNPDVTITSTTSINDGNWHHVAATRIMNSGAMAIYVDGNLEATAIGSTTPRNAPPQISIGSMQTLVSFFEGTIDELRIWNRALCASEIQNNMNGEVAKNSNGLLAYYKFNQGVDNNNNSAIATLIDSTSNGYNGTLNNFTLMGATSNFVAPGAVTTGSMVTVFTNSLSAVATATDVACNGDASGAASVAVSGYTPYTYAWSSGGTGSAQGSLLAGTYTCTIGNGCGTITQTVTVNEPLAISPNFTVQNVNCYGANDASVSVSPSGGTPAYMVTWPSLGSGTMQNGLTAGTYTCVITDNNGCISTTTVTVTQPNAITTVLSPTLCAGSGIQVGTHFYTTAGTYTDVLTAHNGCDSTITTNLTVNHATAAFTWAGVTCLCPVIGFMDSSYTSASDPIVAWSWTFAGGTPSTANVQNPGGVTFAYGNHVVCLKVTTANGCTDSICKNVFENVADVNYYSNAPMLTIYPNPAQNNFTIETNSTEKQTLNVFDVNGKLVLSQSINGTTNINSEALAPGAYNISLINKYGVTNKRLVIVK
jgi:hypothetical protein